MAVGCPYCHRDAEQVTGMRVYPHRPDLWKKNFYLCEPCDAYVGCHGTSVIPLGRLANAELREAKMRAHKAFDPLWGGDYAKYTRREAYTWLAEQMGLTDAQCHIGMFDVAQCERVVELCRGL